jgi:hypothetical protein
MTPELTAKLQQWEEAKQQAELAKKQEMSLRKECLALAFPDGAIGTNTMDLAAGWKLKGTYKLNYSFDETALDPVLTRIRDQFKISTDNLVRIKREPAMTEIKKLTEDQRLALEEALITRPGTPTLELVPPKKK